MSSNIDLPIEKCTIKASAPQKLEPGRLGVERTFKTNASRITLNPNLSVFKYDVDINLIYQKQNGDDAKKSLTKGPKNDCLSQVRGKYANAALKVVFDTKLKGFKDIDLFYDSQSNLYSTTKIPDIHENIAPKDVVPGDNDCKSVEVKITKVVDSFQVSTNDTKLTVNPTFGKADVTLLEALNTIISGSLNHKNELITYKGVHYVLDPSGLGFRQDQLPALSGSQYMGVGISEAVRTYEGDSKGESALYCVVDLRKTAFHADYQPLMEKFGSLVNANYREPLRKNLKAVDPQGMYLREMVKGLVVRLNYGQNRGRGEHARSFIIGGFGPCPAEATFVSQGKTWTVQQYFYETFGITLQYPNFLTVFDKKTRGVLYPPELLIVGENQRATTNQLTKDGQDKLVKATAILPSAREGELAKLANYTGLDGTNKALEKVGIRIAPETLIVKGRILPTPIIGSSEGRKLMVQNNCKWQSQKFKVAMTLPKWTFVSIDSGINVEVFKTKLRDRVISSGMTWTKPNERIYKNNDRFNVEEIISSEKNQSTKFIFFIVRDSLNLHQEIKLLEQKYDILTQEVRATVAGKVVEKGQPQTVENIVNKMNLKLGGVNWEVQGYNIPNAKNPSNLLDATAGRLIFGFESSRGLGDDVVCVGYSANATKNVQNFIGNYKYVKQNKDIYGQVLRPAVLEMIKKYKESRNADPKHLYIYLNGISEGQFSMVANDYADKVKQACQEYSEKCRPHITIMCVSKAPNERITNGTITGNRAAEQNIAPGSCVDTKIVNPHINEFFLNSHSAFQGSARTPKFSHVFDTAKLPMDFHEGLAHQLSFLHGIVSSTTSLPSPIIIADRYSKRGSSNYKTSSRSDDRSVNSVNEVNFDALNSNLSYSQKHLINYRFNA
ncbi:unnamed protein product [Caenorhabditis angaria]|uniref:Piwi domain-containing protein n=1 Tax=Caenorhabditis angaria TaxID=860376 RepID=A0A9P1J6B9_9PELO|nr:unnamed protein product [Caenorhabditis angaria]